MTETGAGPSRPLTFLMAAATGLIVANIYFAQPLIALIGPEVGLGEAAGSLVVTLTQLGYAVGLILLVTLADRFENRVLICATTLAGAAALAVTATVSNGPVFLLASFAVGIASTSVQMLVPFAAHLAPPERRGQVVGNVMSGLLLGILLARPAAGLVAHHFGWRTVFAGAALLDVAVAALLWRTLPVRRPVPVLGYGTLLASLWPVLRDNPVLQRRGFYQACLFAAFTLFWTAVPLWLAGPAFGLSQDGIALFALCGASGALAAPVAGRLADRGYLGVATLAAFGLAIASFAASGLVRTSLLGLAAAAIGLDAGVQLHQITAQRVIYGLPAEIRSRVTALYIASLFMGGALGSAAASPVYARAGWPGIAALGTAFGVVALAAFLWHRRRDAQG